MVANFYASLCILFSKTLDLEKVAIVEMSLKVVQGHQNWHFYLDLVRLLQTENLHDPE